MTISPATRCTPEPDITWWRDGAWVKTPRAEAIAHRERTGFLRWRTDDGWTVLDEVRPWLSAPDWPAETP